MKRLLNYFIRGALFTIPIVLSIYLIFSVIAKVDGMIDFGFPGLGLLLVLMGITLVGYFVNTLFTRPIFEYFESIIARIPLLKIIYSAIKDLMEAFVGDKKKFNVPVIIDSTATVKRLGFITQEDLSGLGLKNHVAVYCPHSYAFSGNLLIVERKNIKILDANATAVMKFIVSGGAISLDEAAELEEESKA